MGADDCDVLAILSPTSSVHHRVSVSPGKLQCFHVNLQTATKTERQNCVLPIINESEMFSEDLIQIGI